ncbi:hypothetical protein SAMN05421505_113156 [Sinosporangium album]|uniref:Uncharacterized protein n=1 Tax=Sinosporangium album TaxID=504805 RepID=A0A1G8B634_9ACTN|nr:hypothetical protein SAMN05421505_113156 [Sinosporangium album]
MVQAIPEHCGGRYDGTGYWEPKKAFHDIARVYGDF